jgi:quercetin dioxygenase-like cupin family protein
MPYERGADHPTFDLGGTAITSFIGPSRGGTECVLYRADLSPGSGLPPHRHDHLETFAVLSGGGTFHIDENVFEIGSGDSVVVPVGARHFLEAGPEGAVLMVAMLPGTVMIRDDGSEAVPPWLS